MKNDSACPQCLAIAHGRRVKFKIFTIFFGLFFLLSFFQFASAQVSGEGLTISPPILELETKPGETYNQTIKITNPTNNLIEVYPQVMNFRASGEGGEPAFYPATEEEAKFSLAQWIKFNQSKVALTPNQVVEFNYSIEVPADAEAGGHYGVIFFATQPPKAEENQNQISISSMIGSLILAKIPGTIIEKGFLESFKANRIYLKLPATFEVRISNLGNVHFKPKGNITIKGMFGIDDKIIVNQAKGNVLPDSIRKFEEKWQPQKIIIGRYTADLRVVYGESEKTLDGQIVFWVLPLWFLLALGGLIISIVVLILYLKRRKARRYY
ncbi:MAG: exported protein of unknown function [Candidatus Berkelbacteria bacterium Athens1014_28]|uniref:DUF916 domain-containing protein n=1 Tax=Candidatus Berkelbacteria bacterium Athens1014_28 TaxID=2017145 RepID=A0A554LPA6_9BACT|nr:MAG: exported protein of unknown function [Candidatus Berkelbacteria bacterium Athens1014_28]